MQRQPLFKTVVLFCFLALYASALSSAELTVQDILKNMKQQEALIEDLQFELRQTMYLKTIKEKQQLSAQVKFKKPDLLSVEYKSPLEQLVIARDEEVAMYIKEKGNWQETSRQKVADVLGKNWKANYGLWVSEEIEKNYNASTVNSGGNQVGLILTPKDKTYKFTMTVYLEKQNWLPVKTIWEDENQVITTEISNIKRNTKLSEDVFKFR